MILSPCIEWLFADGSLPFPERIRAAAGAGFRQVEFWTSSDKDIGDVQRAIRESGIRITAFVSEPTGRLVDPATHHEFLRGVSRTCGLATELGAENLIVVSGDALPGVGRDAQHRAVVEALRRAAPIASESGLRVILEPLNTLVDHPGYFLDSTIEGLEIVREVDHQAVRLLYDMYHSVVMGEDPSTVLAGAGDLVGHVHIADVPGRHEPGSGTIDWPRRLADLRSAGYAGAIGLEFMPRRDTISSLDYVRGLAARLA